MLCSSSLLVSLQINRNTQQLNRSARTNVRILVDVKLSHREKSRILLSLTKRNDTRERVHEVLVEVDSTVIVIRTV